MEGVMTRAQKIAAYKKLIQQVSAVRLERCAKKAARAERANNASAANFWAGREG